MKKLLLLLMIIPMIGVGQMNDGEYSYSNSEITLEISMFNYGEDISIVIINNLSSEKIQGDGYWHSINMNGVDEDYDGPDGFYEFQTSDCGYDFDATNSNKIILSQFGCENGREDKTYILYSK